MGDIGSGAFGLRSSLPGYDVLAEGLGSPNINFDTRYTDIGTVIAAGLIQCGGSAISFPTMPYVPIVTIAAWDGTDLNADQVFYQGSGGPLTGHAWIPAIAIVTTSNIQVVAYTNPFYATSTYNNPNGSYYLYSVFASG